MATAAESDTFLGNHPFGLGTSNGRIPLVEIQENPLFGNPEWLTERWTLSYRLAKRLFDVLVTSTIALAALPLVPVLAALIKMDSRGPVLYSQLRIGEHGRRFRLYKFRSMHNGADRGAVYAEHNDPRVTRIGRFLRKTRMDELPQLWNVLIGDMSLIGPRPELPATERMLEDGIPGFSMRTVVKPGLTGWAQICAPYANTIELSSVKLEYDMYYIRNASLWLDLRIAWRTGLVMFRLAGQ